MTISSDPFGIAEHERKMKWAQWLSGVMAACAFLTLCLSIFYSTLLFWALGYWLAYGFLTLKAGYHRKHIQKNEIRRHA